MAFKDKGGCIIKCAEYFREEIVEHSKKLPELSWPPSLEELIQNVRTPPPQALLLFLKHILQTDSSTGKKNKSEAIERFINSFTAVDSSDARDFPKEKTALIIDLMALLRTVSSIPSTFERLAWKVLSLIPKGYHRVDLVAVLLWDIDKGGREGKTWYIKKGYCQIRAVKSAKRIFKVSFLWRTRPGWSNWYLKL